MVVNWTNITSMGEIVAGANTNTGGWFWTMLMFGLFILFTIFLAPFGFSAALLMGAFLSLILGFFLAYSGLVSWTWVMVFAGIIFFMILYIIYSTPKYKE